MGVTLPFAESDHGGVFILSGPDAGQFVPYSEGALGPATEAGFGAELGRVDYFGPFEFTGDFVYGNRAKLFLSGNLEVISLGFGVAYSAMGKIGEDKGFTITTTVQAGIGLNLIPISPISGGFNYGWITK